MQPATAPRRPLLTADDILVWQRVNAATHAEAEARALAINIDAVLHDVLLMHPTHGLQAACDHAWRTRGRHLPRAHRQAARDELEKIGWVRKVREAAE